MAYTRKGRSSKKTGGSRYRGRARRTSSPKRTVRRNSPQVLRIVVEQSGPAADPVQALAGRLTEPSTPRKARF